MFGTKLSALLLAVFLLTYSLVNAQGQQLANYLGTGANPRLTLQLSPNNGPKWGSFTIDYQGIGNLPWSSDPSSNWSPWNVLDEAGNYYGTITLLSDGNTATWQGYVAGQNGYYLEGINFTFNPNINAYQLTVNQIHGGGSAGPFPNAPLATPAVYPGTNTPINFSVSGPQIIDDKGDHILLKGIVRPSLEWNPQGQFLSPQDIENIRKWNSNAIRLDLNQNYWLASDPVTENGSYKQIINAIVYYATQNKMAVILDLHWVVNGQQSPMANPDSLQFWSEVATDYKSFGTVLFELFNEPEGIDQNTWLNGNGTYVGYQQLYNAVRATGANNICIVNGLDYGYDLSFVNDNFKLNGVNIVYGSHPYNEKGAPGYQGPGKDFANNFSGVLGKFPLIFTEFGVNQSNYFPTGYQDVYTRILAYANANQINYTAFAWWVEAQPANADVFPCVISDWSGTPLNGGVMIHQDMLAQPGSKYTYRQR